MAEEDSRAEYIYVSLDGLVEAYLNLGSPENGPNATKVKWLPQGKIVTGVGQARDNVGFADVNCDGRADYLTVSSTDGSVQLWLNRGKPDNGINDLRKWCGILTVILLVVLAGMRRVSCLRI
ncbi:hypothetical protein IFR05_008850 [Cadophora sp. M221]|nr:hypothetical protein IFR05_008850 [Cadophora sp. M221]